MISKSYQDCWGRVGLHVKSPEASVGISTVLTTAVAPALNGIVSTSDDT